MQALRLLVLAHYYKQIGKGYYQELANKFNSAQDKFEVLVLPDIGIQVVTLNPAGGGGGSNDVNQSLVLHVEAIAGAKVQFSAEQIGKYSETKVHDEMDAKVEELCSQAKCFLLSSLAIMVLAAVFPVASLGFDVDWVRNDLAKDLVYCSDAVAVLSALGSIMLVVNLVLKQGLKSQMKITLPFFKKNNQISVKGHKELLLNNHIYQNISMANFVSGQVIHVNLKAILIYLHLINLKGLLSDAGLKIFGKDYFAVHGADIDDQALVVEVR